jgi:colanic acid biosynthesis glycosyl transferase WcaI
MLEAARRIPGATFIINGDGSARAALEHDAADIPNIKFGGYQPRERVPEVLATADIHVVPLRVGLGAVSVPSKTYSILAAGRAVVAAIDEGTEVPRILAESGAGVSVPPDDPDSFVIALERLLADAELRTEMGRKGRRWANSTVSPDAVARAYLNLVDARPAVAPGR